MIYIVVLNWNSDQDTVKCIKSLLNLKCINEFRIVICDNDSKVESFQKIENYLKMEHADKTISLNERDIDSFKVSNEKIILIKNNENYGYAGGNNIGLKLAMMQDGMQYAWVLNNDTEVDKDALTALVEKMLSDAHIGLCGSRLVEMETKYKVQALGGTINPWFCTTREIGSDLTITDIVNEEEWEEKIDFVVGASLFFSRFCLEKVGLLCEDYFLYYEEIDYCNRIKQNNLKIGIASKSIVFHEQGASTDKGKSKIADFCSIKNRVLISKKFYKSYTLFVRISLFGVAINRSFRKQFDRIPSILHLIIK
ncbi:glycosyltransferase family 2 protein [Acinetobacter apis]|uniref:Glycosyltransferase 2-like domain-containing protein n=1 Tax=Acinetobacter apis TaxID=1229165 RepID=A0A217EHI8_9GAMM|nr:glycosyltransferase family 2 protein [Acinetobacter apis]SNQ29953.1 hypothetical protein SAMN05444584_1932 [Acinetobacter apis]